MPTPPPCDLCLLSLGERFFLWAMRLWCVEIRAWRPEQPRTPYDSLLWRGFDVAGLGDALPEFAMFMDTVLHGVHTPLGIHPPPCPRLGTDEARMLTAFGLARCGYGLPLHRHLATMLAPTAARVAGGHLEAFVEQLRDAQIDLAPARDIAERDRLRSLQ